MHIKIYAYNDNGEIIIEDFYDVKKCHYEQQGTNGNYLFLEFEEGSPNWKRFLPYGETAIEINKDDAFAIITYRNQRRKALLDNA